MDLRKFYKEDYRGKFRYLLMYHLLDKSIKEYDGFDSQNGEDWLNSHFLKKKYFWATLKFIDENTISQHKTIFWQDMIIGRIPTSFAYEVLNSQGHSKEWIIDKILDGCEGTEDAAAEERRKNLQDEVIKVISSNLKDRSIKKSGLKLTALHPTLVSTPDAMGLNSVVEIKCPVSQDAEKDYIKPGVEVDAHPMKILRKKFYTEVQLQMEVGVVNEGYFCLVCPNFESTRKVRIIKVTYDPKYNRSVAKRLEEFWYSHVFEKLIDKYNEANINDDYDYSSYESDD